MRWSRYVRTLIGCALALLALIFAAIVVIDPYDTGRVVALKGGTPRYGQRMADASRGRNPAFDSAIIGNSTIQLVNPERLNALTGGKFVSLAIPGTGPYEQLLVLDWFLRHHPDAKFIVLGLDSSWCDAPRAFGPAGETYPFPAWLYGRSGWDYFTHLLSYKSVEAASRRVSLLLGRAQPARPDGFNDYEAGRTYDPNAAERRIAQAGPDNDMAEEAGSHADAVDDDATNLPFDMLGAVLRDHLPRGARVVLVFPPREAARLPAKASPGAALIETCKDNAASFKLQPNMGVVDFLHDDALSRDPANFWDGVHYRGNVARQIEAAIAGKPVTQE